MRIQGNDRSVQDTGQICVGKRRGSDLAIETKHGRQRTPKAGPFPLAPCGQRACACTTLPEKSGKLVCDKEWIGVPTAVLADVVPCRKGAEFSELPVARTGSCADLALSWGGLHWRKRGLPRMRCAGATHERCDDCAHGQARGLLAECEALKVANRQGSRGRRRGRRT